jgi:hypothetical protein
MPSEMDIFASGVKAAGSAVQAVVVDGFPADAGAAIRVTLDSDQIVRLIGVTKPRLLYLHEGWFDCESEIDDCLADLGIETGDDIDISPLSALKRNGKSYNGQLCIVYAAFVADGVLHLCFEEAEWYVEFQQKITDLSERQRVILAENRKNSNMQSALEIKRKASILAASPEFNFNRPSREKRAYLARDMFPESDEWEIERLVDEATNTDFLNKARASES